MSDRLRRWRRNAKMTQFSKKIPLARDSTLDNPRSWWDKQIMEQARRSRAEAVAADRLVPDNRVTDTLGKTWAAPLTLAGSVAGAANVAAARIAGDKRAGMSIRDNGIQFESGYFGIPDRAFTLGNAVLHGPGSKPDDRNNRYDKQPTFATTAEHESGHTYQYQQPGFIPGYLYQLVRQALTGQPNSYEREADDFGDWKSRRRGGGW
jgi:hypothetical protein